MANYIFKINGDHGTIKAPNLDEACDIIKRMVENDPLFGGWGHGNTQFSPYDGEPLPIRAFSDFSEKCLIRDYLLAHPITGDPLDGRGRAYLEREMAESHDFLPRPHRRSPSPATL